MTGSRTTTTGNRILTTILFMDLVGSTKLAAEIGDAAWRRLLDQHYQSAHAVLVRQVSAGHAQPRARRDVLCGFTSTDATCSRGTSDQGAGGDLCLSQIQPR